MASAAPSDAPPAPPPSVLYFAIGSMINPSSLAARKLTPLRSWPAEALDMHLSFDLGAAGMADAQPRAGASFHGVLHEMSAADMAALDKIEMSYARVAARVRKYDGEVVEATIYSCPRGADGKPVGAIFGAASGKTTQRYLEIIAAGCRHYGVREEYVTELLARPCEPRTAPADFISVEVPPGTPVWTEERLAAEPVSEDSITIALNGVVTRMKGGSVMSLYKRLGAHGKHTEVTMAAALFDPKYGAPKALKDFTREHCAYFRDMVTRMLSKVDGMTIEVVATMEQEHCDD